MAANRASACIQARLLAEYPEARCELFAANPWQLLVAVILSARTSDERVNQVMATLNEHFIHVQAYADMDPRELEPLISKVPLASGKARFIVESARMIMERFAGQVPQTVEQLQRLPGVGRKTAAVVAGNAFNVPAIAVDVHVERIVPRLGWSSDAQHPNIERAFVDNVAEEEWVVLCHRFIRLGRDFCRPKKPWCSRCPLQHECPQVGVQDAR